MGGGGRGSSVPTSLCGSLLLAVTERKVGKWRNWKSTHVHPITIRTYKLGKITQAVGCSDVGTSSHIYFPPYITFLSPFSLPRAMVSVRKEGGAAVVKKGGRKKGEERGDCSKECARGLIQRGANPFFLFLLPKERRGERRKGNRQQTFLFKTCWRKTKILSPMFSFHALEEEKEIVIGNYEGRKGKVREGGRGLRPPLQSINAKRGARSL